MMSRKGSGERADRQEREAELPGQCVLSRLQFKAIPLRLGGGRAPPSFRSAAGGQGPAGLGWAPSSTQGPWRGAERWERGCGSVPWQTPAPSGGRGFGTNVGTQGSKVPVKVPCRFLPSEGKLGEDVRAPRGPERVSTKLVRQAGRQAGRPPGGRGARWCPCPGHSAQLGLWTPRSVWSPRGCPRVSGWESACGPLCPLPLPREAAHAWPQGRWWRGWCLGQGHRGGMWEAGRGSSHGQQGCPRSPGPATSPHSSVLRGRVGPIPPQLCME